MKGCLQCSISTSRWLHAIQALIAARHVNNLYGAMMNKSFTIFLERLNKPVTHAGQCWNSLYVALIRPAGMGLWGLKWYTHYPKNLLLSCCVTIYLKGPKLWGLARVGAFSRVLADGWLFGSYWPCNWKAEEQIMLQEHFRKFQFKCLIFGSIVTGRNSSWAQDKSTKLRAAFQGSRGVFNA